ncbi:c-type cytochrome [Aliiglaciecola aliphaticivorans]
MSNKLILSQAYAVDKTYLEDNRFEQVSNDQIEHGKRLSAVLGCIGCHTLDLTGEDWTEPELGVLWTANLTVSVTEYSQAELTDMIVKGKRPDRALMDMPSYLFSSLHESDVDALVAYLKTIPVKGEKHPDPTIGPQLAKDIDSGAFKNSVEMVAEMKNQSPPDMGTDFAFARYIVRATCAECHGMDLKGSTEEMADSPRDPIFAW